jgi:hypothetical protein
MDLRNSASDGFASVNVSDSSIPTTRQVTHMDLRNSASDGLASVNVSDSSMSTTRQNACELLRRAAAVLRESTMGVNTSRLDNSTVSISSYNNSQRHHHVHVSSSRLDSSTASVSSYNSRQRHDYVPLHHDLRGDINMARVNGAVTRAGRRGVSGHEAAEKYYVDARSRGMAAFDDQKSSSSSSSSSSSEDCHVNKLLPAHKLSASQAATNHRSVTVAQSLSVSPTRVKNVAQNPKYKVMNDNAHVHSAKPYTYSPRTPDANTQSQKPASDPQRTHQQSPANNASASHSPPRSTPQKNSESESYIDRIRDQKHVHHSRASAGGSLHGRSTVVCASRHATYNETRARANAGLAESLQFRSPHKQTYKEENLTGRYSDSDSWDDTAVDRITDMSPWMKHTPKKQGNTRRRSVAGVDHVNTPSKSHDCRQTDKDDDDDDDDDDLFQQLEDTFHRFSSAKKNPREGMGTPKSVPEAKEMFDEDGRHPEDLYARLGDVFARSSPSLRAQGVNSPGRNAVEAQERRERRVSRENSCVSQGKDSGSELVWNGEGGVTAEFVRAVLSGQVSGVRLVCVRACVCVCVCVCGV